MNINSGDELENLAQTMKSMETEMGIYVSDLTKITAERDELKLAHLHLLMNRGRVPVHALMNAAISCSRSRNTSEAHEAMISSVSSVFFLASVFEAFFVLPSVTSSPLT